MEITKRAKINYLILKLIGTLLFATSVVFLIIAICNYGNKNNDFFATFSMSGIPFLFAGVCCLIAGFKPEFAKLKSKKQPAYEIVPSENVCADCGKAIDADSVYCKFCGKKQSK